MKKKRGNHSSQKLFYPISEKYMPFKYAPENEFHPIKLTNPRFQSEWTTFTQVLISFLSRFFLVLILGL